MFNTFNLIYRVHFIFFQLSSRMHNGTCLSPLVTLTILISLIPKICRIISEIFQDVPFWGWYIYMANFRKKNCQCLHGFTLLLGVYRTSIGKTTSSLPFTPRCCILNVLQFRCLLISTQALLEVLDWQFLLSCSLSPHLD